MFRQQVPAYERAREITAPTGRASNFAYVVITSERSRILPPWRDGGCNLLAICDGFIWTSRECEGESSLITRKIIDYREREAEREIRERGLGEAKRGETDTDKFAEALDNEISYLFYTRVGYFWMLLYILMHVERHREDRKREGKRFGTPEKELFRH